MRREKLIEYRGERTQAEMAAQYNVAQQAWGQWETGVKRPTVDKMKRMELDSGIPMEELFPDVFCNLT